MMPPQPGEIYWAYLDERERRPVIVVSREELNRGHYVTVVPLTSAKLEARRDLPNCVPLRAGRNGLDKDCVAQAELMASLHQSYLDLRTGMIDTLDGESMRNVIRAMGYVISADCEPV
ncbi:MAG: type II toxin-antitoxin system PemK/MazF family toxin [Phycisphaerales bacterium]|nr:MAG: type II toxin-antitoxin system PemK/MazF family toxin [Phycisphaerales bacterium]